jgi:acetyltransferase
MESRHPLHALFEPVSVLMVVGASRPPWLRPLGEGLESARVPVRVVDAAGQPVGRHSRQAVRDGALPRGGLALLAVAAAEVPAALRLAAAQGAAWAVVLPAATDADEAAHWRGRARSLGLRLVGPGSLGFVRPSLRLNAARTGALPDAGSVALVSQSGTLNAALLDWVADHAVGFSLVASLGAESDADLAQVLDFLSVDAQTQAVVVYLEAVREARPFMSALRALSLLKPVIVLKGHRHDQPTPAMRTHSAVLCGTDAIHAAALRRAGAIQIRFFQQMFTAARVLTAHPGPLGRRVGLIANGQGPAVLLADQALFAGLQPYPVDAARNLGIDAGPADYARALAALAGNPDIDGLVVALAPHLGVDIDGITRAVIEARQRLRKPLFACWLGDRRLREATRMLEAAGIPTYPVPEAAIDAYATVSAFHDNQRLLQQVPRPLPGHEAPDVDCARSLIAAALAADRRVLVDAEAAALLEAFRIPVSPTRLARTADDAVRLAIAAGFPVVLKIAAPALEHKSDAGGVALDVRGPAEVRARYHEILDAVAGAHPGLHPAGVTVQPMRMGRHGRELYVGLLRDAVFGPVIVFGAGGVRVESVRDLTLELPPLNRFLARSMIDRTRIGATLAASPGAPAVDPAALEALLVAVGEIAAELPWIAAMDINPVIVDDEGAVAVDARIVIDPTPGTDPPRHRHMAIAPWPGHLARTIHARDGSPLLLRPIQPEDADLLQAFMHGLSAESRYLRFISVLAELPRRLLIRYTQLDHDREVALVAVAPDADPRGRIVGVVRYLLDADREHCEFAITLADAWQGRGLGLILMRAIVEAARARRLRRIDGHVLATNTRMLALLRRMGFQVKTDRDDPTMRRVWLDLPVSVGDDAAGVPALSSPGPGDSR